MVGNNESGSVRRRFRLVTRGNLEIKIRGPQEKLLMVKMMCQVGNKNNTRGK